MLLVTVAFANNFLNSRLAENEFSAVKQFMQTVALQTDDVAWTIGRTQTVRYASNFGTVNFEVGALNYTLYVNDVVIVNFTTGILLFNMPISRYNMGNGYFGQILPGSDRSFLQAGTSAPVAHVFAIEKVPMGDGNYIRVVVVPAVRMLNSTITSTNSTTNYYKFYLPLFSLGSSPRNSQSVTLVGNVVSVKTEGTVNKVKVEASFPKTTLGFDNTFFKFENVNEEVLVPAGSVMEFYTGGVTVSLGLQI